MGRIGILGYDSIYTYDAQGSLLLRTTETDGVLSSIAEYRYDAHGNQTRCTETGYGEDGSISYETVTEMSYRYLELPDYDVFMNALSYTTTMMNMAW